MLTLVILYKYTLVCVHLLKHSPLATATMVYGDDSLPVSDSHRQFQSSQGSSASNLSVYSQTFATHDADCAYNLWQGFFWFSILQHMYKSFPCAHINLTSFLTDKQQ